MKKLGGYVGWGLGIGAIVLSPALLIVGLPLLFGLCIDMVELAGWLPLVLILAGATAFVLLRRAVPAALLRHCGAMIHARLRFGQPTRLDQAP